MKYKYVDDVDIVDYILIFALKVVTKYYRYIYNIRNVLSTRVFRVISPIGYDSNDFKNDRTVCKADYQFI